jgi:hypothetical protein
MHPVKRAGGRVIAVKRGPPQTVYTGWFTFFEGRRLKAGSTRRYSPSVLAMMLRWISEVPP